MQNFHQKIVTIVADARKIGALQGRHFEAMPPILPILKRYRDFY